MYEFLIGNSNQNIIHYIVAEVLLWVHGVNSPTLRIMENEGLFTNMQENSYHRGQSRPAWHPGDLNDSSTARVLRWSPISSPVKPSPLRRIHSLRSHQPPPLLYLQEKENPLSYPAAFIHELGVPLLGNNEM
ncbi:hypothetical protein AVEN_101572-1 [Araneus ventricosus]|uniref:Uncharacterized protein n=1 Tax=Araneus ventricosus TaxID=182803 RepID=A0A4Y2NEB7_ARAVE|nr:hypothetical protein AVEN_101572-1 [Araneus ventricosus]